MDGGSARRRDLRLKAHSSRKRQISIRPARFEPATAASERPQTVALDRSATGIGNLL